MSGWTRYSKMVSKRYRRLGKGRYRSNYTTLQKQTRNIKRKLRAYEQKYDAELDSTWRGKYDEIPSLVYSGLPFNPNGHHCSCACLDEFDTDGGLLVAGESIQAISDPREENISDASDFETSGDELQYRIRHIPRDNFRPWVLNGVHAENQETMTPVQSFAKEVRSTQKNKGGNVSKGFSSYSSLSARTRTGNIRAVSLKSKSVSDGYDSGLGQDDVPGKLSVCSGKCMCSACKSRSIDCQRLQQKARRKSKLAMEIFAMKEELKKKQKKLNNIRDKRLITILGKKDIKNEEKLRYVLYLSDAMKVINLREVYHRELGNSEVEDSTSDSGKESLEDVGLSGCRDSLNIDEALDVEKPMILPVNGGLQKEEKSAQVPQARDPLTLCDTEEKNDVNKYSGKKIRAQCEACSWRAEDQQNVMSKLRVGRSKAKDTKLKAQDLQSSCVSLGNTKSNARIQSQVHPTAEGTGGTSSRNGSEHPFLAEVLQIGDGRNLKSVMLSAEGGKAASETMQGRQKKGIHVADENANPPRKESTDFKLKTHLKKTNLAKQRKTTAEKEDLRKEDQRHTLTNPEENLSPSNLGGLKRDNTDLGESQSFRESPGELAEIKREHLVQKHESLRKAVSMRAERIYSADAVLQLNQARKSVYQMDLLLNDDKTEQKLGNGSISVRPTKFVREKVENGEQHGLEAKESKRVADKLVFKYGMTRELRNLTMEHMITRAFSFSYFHIAPPYLKTKWDRRTKRAFMRGFYEEKLSAEEIAQAESQTLTKLDREMVIKENIGVESTQPQSPRLGVRRLSYPATGQVMRGIRRLESAENFDEKMKANVANNNSLPTSRIGTRASISQVRQPKPPSLQPNSPFLSSTKSSPTTESRANSITTSEVREYDTIQEVMEKINNRHRISDKSMLMRNIARLATKRASVIPVQLNIGLDSPTGTRSFVSTNRSDYDSPRLQQTPRSVDLGDRILLHRRSGKETTVRRIERLSATRPPLRSAVSLPRLTNSRLTEARGSADSVKSEGLDDS